MRRTPIEHRRPLVSALGTAIVAAMLVAACGSGTATPASTGSSAVSVAPPSTATTEASASAVATPLPSPTPPATPTPAPTLLPAVPITLNAVVTGLPNLIGLSSAPGDPRLFAIGQQGRISIVRDGKVAGTFLDISARLSFVGERGLLGLAFHPQYAANGRFFVRYTDRSGNLKISEFRVSGDADKADAGSEKVLMTIPHPSYANHNGGRIEFGPDGYLYIGTGDGGGRGDPNSRGQSLASPLGKLLRIDVDKADAGLPYAIPPTNPFVGMSGRLPAIWSYGLRNPDTLSFDTLNGDLWIADVGQDLWEEINRATAESGGGRATNFGWSIMEGGHCYKPASGCKTTGLTPPLTEYAHGSGDSVGCSVIGGYVYRGTLHPSLYGRYFFGDYCTGKIWNVTAAGPDGQAPQKLLESGLQITGWGQDSSGELYLTATNGSIYQLG
jgi:glucose/arabinose dehydrogenase